jgi:peptidylprolyl isomerase
MVGVTIFLAVVGSLLAGSAPAGAAVDRLTDVQVVEHDADQPTIEFASPWSVKKSGSRVLSKGEGVGALAGQRISFDYVVYDGRTGKMVESSFGERTGTVVLDRRQTNAFLVRSLTGARVGERVLVALAPSEGLAKGLVSQGVAKRDTLLMLFDVRQVHQPLARASGVPQPLPFPEGQPSVRLRVDGEPEITMPANNPPGALDVATLVKGSGPVVEANDSITVHYEGVIWSTGKVFDSTWRKGRPSDFSIGTGRVIPGWDAGLVGQTVGSQVLLVVPPDQGYGIDGNPAAGISGTDTLVFVIDILDKF